MPYARMRRRRPPPFGLIAAGAVVVVLVVVGVAVQGTRSSFERSRDDFTPRAQTAVRERFIAPSAVRFLGTPTIRDEGIDTVLRGECDAPNRMNVPIRHAWRVAFRDGKIVEVHVTER